MGHRYEHTKIKVGKFVYTISKVIVENGRNFYVVNRNDSKFKIGKTYWSKADIERHYPNLRGKLGRV